MYKVAVIGDKGSVLAFRAIGVEVFTPTGADEIRRTVDRLARDQYGVIYMTEAYAALIPQTLEHYKTKPVPAIVYIPSAQGSLGMGMQNISDNVEKAVGMNIF